MVVVPLSGVANAYAAGKMPGIAGAGDVAAPAQGSFPEIIGKAVKDAIATMRNGEQVAAAGLQGKASAQDVVQATLSAELTVQAVTTVRDKLVNAYLDIMRMPI
ncbi:flagellar hook-basal body complex protein FliE [Niveispirillum fermenti]|uniref:flagellar hook-basal body complex protein FliE n=1 Tax=Niveispirillum fermenti TaxID=1233113 RepID=UPI003A8A9407